MSSEGFKEFRQNVWKYIRTQQQKGVKVDPKYWLSDREMFARSFEAHVQYKLEKNGRKNTYLSGNPQSGMWPEPHVSEKLEKHFDELFDTFKNSEHLKKAMLPNEIGQIDFDTADEAQTSLATQNNEYLELFTKKTKDINFGDTPVEIWLPEARKLFISKVDDGVFSGVVKSYDSEGGNYGETLTQFEKMTLPNVVQALKIKGYIPNKQETKASTANFLKDLQINQLHIHFHKN